MKLSGVELQVDPGFEALSDDIIDTLARQVAELVHHITPHGVLLVLEALPFVAPNLQEKGMLVDPLLEFRDFDFLRRRSSMEQET